MKRIAKFLVLFFLAIVLLHNNTNAQQSCGAELSPEQINYMNNTRQDRENLSTAFFQQGTINIPLAVHIIRNSFGNGGLNEDSLFTSIEQLNRAYQQAGFEFNLCSTNYINNNDYYNALPKAPIENRPGATKEEREEFLMAVPNLVTGAVNIFYVPNSLYSWSSWPSDKKAYGKDWIVMKNADATDSSTLAHEMGHYFSLYHTHEIGLGLELADGSNCKEAGDELCDTNAEPYINSTNGKGISGCVDEACHYVCKDKDIKDQEYNPNPKNIMSYAQPECKNYFSQEQRLRMQQSYLSDRSYLLAECTQINANACEASDKEALMALYNATDGSNWKNKWDLNTDHKKWYGVSVNNEGCVESLLLGGNNLSGFIPKEIGLLSNVKYMILGENQLEGEVPIEIGLLENLETLYLTYTNLTGSIPVQIEKLINLKHLFLNNNKLTGTVPTAINNMPKLTQLQLYNNELSGCFEPELKNLCAKFYRPTDDQISHGNNFDASFGDFCAYDAGICKDTAPCYATDKDALIALYNATDGANWKNKWDLSAEHKEWPGVSVNNEGCVESLLLGENNLSGFIPKEIGLLSNVKYMILGGNQLEGEIPIEIGLLENLETLYLTYTNLTGSIPVQIEKLINLKHLFLNNNKLTGTIPTAINNMPKLTQLELHNNELSGCFEPELKKLCAKFYRPTDDQISHGNNLDASWSNFCEFNAGICENANAKFVAGDYNKNGIVNHEDALYLGVSYGKSGTACASTEISDCPNWEETVNGVNAKYIDGDRNGIINEADVQVIENNYGATSTMNNTLNTVQKDFSFKIELTEHMRLRQMNKFTFYLYIEDFDDEIADLKGFAGRINFGELSLRFPHVSFFNSNFETAFILQNYDLATNSMDIAVTCTDDINLNPNYPIAELIFVVADDNDGNDYKMVFSDLISINAKGELSEGIDNSYDLDAILPKLGAVKNGNSNLSQNYPNPFSVQTDINYFIPETAKAANLKVYTLTGQLIQTRAIEHTGAGNLKVSSKDVEPGLYIYTLEIDGAANASKKMIVQE